MKKFNNKVVQGTLVKLVGVVGMHPVKKIHETRQWITVVGVSGRFERDQVQRFTNSTITEEELLLRAKERRLRSNALSNDSPSLTNTAIDVHVNQLNNSTKMTGD